MKAAPDLAKASLLTPSKLFAAVNIVIADPDYKLALLIKKLLATLGCRRIYIVGDGAEVIELMKEEAIDIVITDWQMKIMGGIDLAVYLRQSIDSPGRMVPIVMLTARNSRKDIQTARDAGITEYVVKPFSAKTLFDRMYAIVENPRGFVLTKSFVGPDRRRISSLTLPPDAESTREFIERRPPIIVPKDQLKQIILDDTPRMIMPDYSLKKKVSAEIELFADAKVLEQSEDIIHDAEEEFFIIIMKDVTTLERAYELLVLNPDNVRRLLMNIKEAAYSITSRAGTFGYTRASEVANLLYHFCQQEYDKDNKYHLIILEKHIQTIAVIFENKIKGDGGMVGEELLQDLTILVDRYLHRKD